MPVLLSLPYLAIYLSCKQWVIFLDFLNVNCTICIAHCVLQIIHRFTYDFICMWFVLTWKWYESIPPAFRFLAWVAELLHRLLLVDRTARPSLHWNNVDIPLGLFIWFEFTHFETQISYCHFIFVLIIIPFKKLSSIKNRFNNIIHYYVIKYKVVSFSGTRHQKDTTRVLFILIYINCRS